MAKAQVLLTFYVTCPLCGTRDKLQPMMDQEGDEMLERMRQIVSGGGGETKIQVECHKCHCCYLVESFVI